MATVSVDDYLAGPEDSHRRELVWGVVREPPAARYGHQAIVTNLTVILTLHVRESQLGIVCVSPIDVVLDKERALIVQPDVIFVSNERAAIIRHQVWGAPDLVIEVASRGTARHDRTTKLEWYGRYGVRECWLVDPKHRLIDIVEFETDGSRCVRRFTGDQRVESSVLLRLAAPAADFFI